jgi:hypothetical protein
MESTKGWVILDFLDAANWDRIESFRVDHETGILTLVWHDYRESEEPPEARELREMVFPADVYRLDISIQAIAPIVGDDAALFLINGHARTLKRIRGMYKPRTTEFGIRDESFFEKRVVRRIHGFWEVIDFHCTPIYSLAVLPKNLGISSLESKDLLFIYNLEEALHRLAAVLGALESGNQADGDFICEKVNTARRVLETVLKIECCYRDIKPKAAYSQILLGSLADLVTKVRPDVKPELKKMAQLLNEFSHDSGKPIVLEKALLACQLVEGYVRGLTDEIQNK